MAANILLTIVLAAVIAVTHGQRIFHQDQMDALRGQGGIHTGSAREQPLLPSRQGVPQVQPSQQGFPQVQPSQQGFPQAQPSQHGSQRVDVCFPDEGDRQFLKPDPVFPPKVSDFSFSLFRKLSEASGDKSIIMSPYSIWSVITLAYFGTLGETKNEINKALHYTDKTHTLSNWQALRFYLERGTGSAELAIANRAYFSDRLELNECLKDSIFDIRRLDFYQVEAAKKTINDDVSRATRGYIKDLIDSIPPETRMVLMNAVFFKGEWETMFKPELTRPQEFIGPAGVSTGNVMMMSRLSDMRLGDAPGLDAKILELPYLNSTISMYLLLPNDPRTPLSSLVSRLDANTFASAVRSIPKDPYPVNLSMPKFKLTSKFKHELIEAVRQLGIRALFDPSRAELGGFANTIPPLTVDTAIHQATVEVNEEGTVAAAATVLLDTRVGPPSALQITFNRPYLFLLVEKQRALPLFIGKITSAADLEQPK